VNSCIPESISIEFNYPILRQWSKESLAVHHSVAKRRADYLELIDAQQWPKDHGYV
jgi:hypothetical protein